MQKSLIFIDAKHDYLLNRGIYIDDIGISFDKKCELEIERFKEHQKLNEASGIPTSLKHFDSLHSPYMKGYHEERGRQSAANGFKRPFADNKQIAEREAKQKELGLSLDRATLFMNYLFTFAKVNCQNTRKAKVISFLTGYSTNTIGDKLSALHSKADDNFIAYEEDMKIVRKYFESLGLTEIVNMIDKDLKI